MPSAYGNYNGSELEPVAEVLRAGIGLYKTKDGWKQAGMNVSYMSHEALSTPKNLVVGTASGYKEAGKLVFDAPNVVVDTVNMAKNPGATFDATREVVNGMADQVRADLSTQEGQSRAVGAALTGGPGAFLLKEAVFASRLSRALSDLGVERSSRRAFANGEVVPFKFSTRGGDPVYGFVQFSGGKLKSQLFSIKNPNPQSAVRAFFQFRNNTFRMARRLGVDKVELQGGAVGNPRVAEFLTKQGFEKKTEPVPDELGGGTEEVFSKVVEVPN